jgi:hypothetical protein
MSNQHPQSRRLRQLLSRINQLKNDSEHDHDGDYESPPDRDKFYNSHELYQEVANKITAEQDIKIVREIALYYLDTMCSVMPDHAATIVFERMQGFES